MLKNISERGQRVQWSFTRKLTLDFHHQIRHVAVKTSHADLTLTRSSRGERATLAYISLVITTCCLHLNLVTHNPSCDSLSLRLTFISSSCFLFLFNKPFPSSQIRCLSLSGKDLEKTPVHSSLPSNYIQLGIQTSLKKLNSFLLISQVGNSSQ